MNSADYIERHRQKAEQMKNRNDARKRLAGIKRLLKRINLRYDKVISGEIIIMAGF